MRLKIKAIIILVANIFASCTTNITDWKKNKLKWSELPSSVWEIKHYPSDEDFEIIKRVYNDRSLIDLKEKKGILVSIHGLLNGAEWNQEIAPFASSQD